VQQHPFFKTMRLRRSTCTIEALMELAKITSHTSINNFRWVAKTFNRMNQCDKNYVLLEIFVPVVHSLVATVAMMIALSHIKEILETSLTVHGLGVTTSGYLATVMTKKEERQFRKLARRPAINVSLMSLRHHLIDRPPL
jgi:hypothetical protein